jgi:hypothetical protein
VHLIPPACIVLTYLAAIDSVSTARVISAIWPIDLHQNDGSVTHGGLNQAPARLSRTIKRPLPTQQKLSQKQRTRTTLDKQAIILTFQLAASRTCGIPNRRIRAFTNNVKCLLSSYVLKKTSATFRGGFCFAVLPATESLNVAKGGTRNAAQVRLRKCPKCDLIIRTNMNSWKAIERERHNEW